MGIDWSRTARWALEATAYQRRVSFSNPTFLPFDTSNSQSWGENSLPVWLVLLGARDEHGRTTATLAGIQRLLTVRGLPSQSEAQVRRALARLKSLKAIVDVGWRTLHTGRTRYNQSVLAGDTHEVYVRMVLGNVAVVGGGAKSGVGVAAELPAAVREAVEGARTRGGARQGAGRPPRCVLAHERTLSGDGLDVFKPHGTPYGLITRKPHESLEKESNRTTEEREETERYREIALLPSEVEHAAAPRTFLEDRVEDLLASSKEDEGCTLSGGAKTVAISVESFASLPAFPGTAVLRPAVVPSPAKLSMDMEVPQMLDLMLDAYTMVCERELPKEFNPHTGRKCKPPDRKVLENAAGELLQSGLSPLRWCEFSFEAWTKGASKSSARPPLRWVYAPLRLETMGDWAKTDFDRRGNRVVVTRSMKKLLQTWTRMMEAVTLGKVRVEDATEQFFPNGQYQRLLAKAGEEARREQAEIDRRVRQGEYVW